MSNLFFNKDLDASKDFIKDKIKQNKSIRIEKDQFFNGQLETNVYTIVYDNISICYRNINERNHDFTIIRVYCGLPESTLTVTKIIIADGYKHNAGIVITKHVFNIDDKNDCRLVDGHQEQPFLTEDNFADACHNYLLENNVAEYEQNFMPAMVLDEADFIRIQQTDLNKLPIE